MSLTKNNNQLSSLQLSIGIAALLIVLILAPVKAQTNNFFGANANSKSDPADVDENNVNAAMPGLSTQPAPPTGTDYTDDEKRMQRKFKGNIARAKQLIGRGDAMMKGSNKNDKDYKKGKILKETGEKWLAELKSADPYAGQEKEKEKAKAKESASAKSK
jgi:hypothetical protein